MVENPKIESIQLANTPSTQALGIKHDFVHEVKSLSVTSILFFASGTIQADVPYVFQEDTMGADEINENFRHLNSEVGTLSDDVESGANSERAQMRTTPTARKI